MIIEFKEDIASDFQGTIIDIETIGEFKNQYADSRRCGNIKQIIFGFLNNKELNIYCATSQESISELNKISRKLLDIIERPFYAFNTDFESSVWFHQIDKIILFDGELNKYKFEKKKDVVKELNLPNYEDPFYDDGLLCMKAWEKGDFQQAIAHNRACLFKERDILIKRTTRQPNVINFNK